MEYYRDATKDTTKQIWPECGLGNSPQELQQELQPSFETIIEHIMSELMYKMQLHLRTKKLQVQSMTQMNLRLLWNTGEAYVLHSLNETET